MTVNAARGELPTGELPVLDDAPPAGAPSIDLTAVRDRAYGRWALDHEPAVRVVPADECVPAPASTWPHGVRMLGDPTWARLEQLSARVDDVVDRLIRLEATAAAGRLDRLERLSGRVEDLAREVVGLASSLERRLRPMHAKGEANSSPFAHYRPASKTAGAGDER